MMATMTTGTFTRATFNDVDITEAFDAAVRQMFADELNRKFDAVVHEALTPPPTVRPVEASGEFTFAVPDYLKYVFIRTRPAAPIAACLWRRNLDGGKWRKRGHPAHRQA